MKVVQSSYYNWYNLTYEAGIGDECMLGCYILEKFEHPRNSLRYVCNHLLEKLREVIHISGSKRLRRKPFQLKGDQ